MKRFKKILAMGTLSAIPAWLTYNVFDIDPEKINLIVVFIYSLSYFSLNELLDKKDN